MSRPYNPSYTLQNIPSPSELATRSSPSPPPSKSFHYLPLPIPSPSSYNNSRQGHFQRQGYPTSSPYTQYQTSPDPSPTSVSRLPSITASFTNGYASPAASSYSSEPGSRDEIDLVEPGSLGGSGDKVSILLQPGQTVALRIVGKPSL